MDELRVGDNVLKAYEPGELGYALPDRYKNDEDQRDYYHMGIVVSVNPLVILHCTTPTVKTDKALGRWKYAFCWKQLTDEEQNMSEIYKAVVTTKRAPPDNAKRAGRGQDRQAVARCGVGELAE